MRGLALEGGGAKGAFHIGVLKAFKEYGCHFDGVVGTSIGAYNAAMWVQDDFEELYNLWITMQPGDLFDIENEYISQLANNQFSKDTLRYLSSQVRAAIKNKGIDTSKLKGVLELTINEEKIRQSKVEFGLITVVIPHFKPVKIYKDLIPEGHIKDYIMASASYPGFKIEPIESQYYVDGGFHENCPVSLLTDKGYNEIVAVRTNSRPIKCKTKDQNIKIINIIPSEDLGGALIFDNELIRKNIEMGYYDAIKVLKGLRGRRYYIERQEEEVFFEAFCNISQENVLEIGKMMKLPNENYRRLLFEQIIPKISSQFKISREASYQYISLVLFEELAEKYTVERWKIYSFQEFITEIQDKLAISEEELSLATEKMGIYLLNQMREKDQQEEDMNT